MAKTLKEFVHDRALWDHKALDCAHKSMPHGQPYSRVIKQVIGAHVHGDEVQIDSALVNEAYLISMCQAGEALDRMRLEEPEDFKKLPPHMAALTQFRHVTTHYGEPNKDAFRPQAMEAMEKKRNEAIAKWDGKYIDYPEELYDKSALLREALISLKYAAFYQAVGKGHKAGEAVSFSDGRVDKIRDEFSAEERAAGLDVPDKKNWCVPLAVMVDYARYRTNMTMDSFDRTSGLARLNYPEIFGNPVLSGLKHFRNQLAHFDDRQFGDKKTEVEAVFNALSCMDAVRPSFKNVPMSEGRGAAKDVDAVAAKYTDLIMGIAQRDSAKVGVMNDFTSWMVKNFTGKARLQEAAIYAAGQIIQLPLEQAKPILEYVRKHKAELLDPKTLENDLADKGHVVNIGVKEFVSSMDTVLNVDAQKPRIIDAERIYHKPFSLAAFKAVLSRNRGEQGIS